MPSLLHAQVKDEGNSINNTCKIDWRIVWNQERSDKKTRRMAPWIYPMGERKIPQCLIMFLIKQKESMCDEYETRQHSNGPTRKKNLVSIRLVLAKCFYSFCVDFDIYHFSETHSKEDATRCWLMLCWSLPNSQENIDLFGCHDKSSYTLK